MLQPTLRNASCSFYTERSGKINGKTHSAYYVIGKYNLENFFFFTFKVLICQNKSKDIHGVNFLRRHYTKN